MSYQRLLNLANGMASDFMFLNNAEIDIPSAGNFLNQLDQIIKEAENAKINFVKEAATGLNYLLEKIILDSLEDKSDVFPTLEKGISLIQSIVDGYNNSGTYDGNTHDFFKTIERLTGMPLGFEAGAEFAGSTLALSGECASCDVGDVLADDDGQERKKYSPVEGNIQIQDESLVRDFIAEGLEYIEEIEVNILNLEKDPEDKEYINAIFRPF